MCEAVAWKKGGSGDRAERDKEGELEETVCISRAIGIKEKGIVATVCEEKGRGGTKIGRGG